MGDTEWRPEKKADRVDWKLASDDFIDSLNDDSGPTTQDIKQLDAAVDKLPTMRIDEAVEKLDADEAVEKLTRLALLLQLGLDYQMFQVDKVQDELDVSLLFRMG
jgi:hypothetical protein